MAFLEAEIVELTRDVFGLVLGLEVEPGGTIEPGRVYRGSVSITGGWRGSVQVLAPEPLVSRAAAAMFGVEEETSLEQRQDALGELANVLGGNVKALLPPPCRLSLPSVVTDAEVGPVPGTRTELALRCLDQVFVVRLVEEAT